MYFVTVHCPGCSHAVTVSLAVKINCLEMLSCVEMLGRVETVIPGASADCVENLTCSVTVKDFCVSPVTVAVDDLEVKEDLDLLEDTAVASLH